MALYIRFAAGSIQFAQNILQGDPESKTCVEFGDHPIENHIKFLILLTSHQSSFSDRIYWISVFSPNPFSHTEVLLVGYILH